jgi:hypothetical protein
MPATQIEYVGFESHDEGREYTLRVHHHGEAELTFVRVILQADFVARRARYQDGPEICFQMLQKELADAEQHPPRRCTVEGVELAAYQAAHAPRPPRRKPHPPFQARNP